MFNIWSSFSFLRRVISNKWYRHFSLASRELGMLVEEGLGLPVVLHTLGVSVQ